MAPQRAAPDIAVRNVILVAGHNFIEPGASFAAPALSRVTKLLQTRGEHKQVPLRFHYWGFSDGVVAESVVVDKDQPQVRPDDPLTLEVGPFWQRVERRFLPIGADRYGSGRKDRRLPAFTREEQAPDNKKKSPPRRVMSLVDVYNSLHALWEHGNAAGGAGVYDRILELSIFSHAALESVLLVNSEDERGGAAARDPADKDGRAKDFIAFPRSFWKRVASVFDSSRGRVCIFGGTATGTAEFLQKLIRETLGSPAYVAKKPLTKLVGFGTVLDPQLVFPDNLPIVVTDSSVRQELGRRNINPESLTFGQVVQVVKEGHGAGYAPAMAEALKIPTRAVLPGVEAVLTKDELRVPASFDDILTFYQAHLDEVELATDEERYGLFRPASAPLGQGAAAASPGEAVTSPLAGVQLFPPEPDPFQGFGGSGSQLLRDALYRHGLAPQGRLQGPRDPARPRQHDAFTIAIVDITSPAPAGGYPYAGFLDRDLYYSASMLKVAAVYAAHRLRDAINSFSPRVQADSTADFFRKLSALLDPIIERALDYSRYRVLKDGKPDVLTRKMRVPQYATLFVTTSEKKGYKVKFTDNFVKHLKEIFTVHDTSTPARDVIRALGYGWINATLQFSGFPGVWLAGDYMAKQKDHWPSLCVDSVNDDLVGQATSSREMAKLLTVFARGLNGGTETEQDMASFLSLGDNWINADTKTYKKEGAKQGLGNLKRENGEKEILSEASIISDPTKTERNKPRFVLVWQNLNNDPSSTRAVAEAVEATIAAYLEALGK